MSSHRTVETNLDSELRPRRKKRSRLGFVIALLVVRVVLPGLCLEIYLRMDRARLDLWALTGRSVGANPMKQWAQVDPSVPIEVVQVARAWARASIAMGSSRLQS